jgi:hypothetical protein
MRPLKTQRPPKSKLTKSALADSLGISRQALNVHLRKPDAPRIADLEGWQVYLAANGRIGTAPADLRREISAERLAILRATREKLDRANSIEAGEMMLAADACRQAAEAMALVFADMERDANELPPQVAGLDAISVFKILKSRIARHHADWTAAFRKVGK